MKETESITMGEKQEQDIQLSQREIKEHLQLIQVQQIELEMKD